ncbi:MAG: dienelactone hydrolase family protein [Dehalococcoidia bacterium]
MSSRWDNLSIEGRQMGVYVSQPEGSGPHPGVVVIMEAFGVNGHIQSVVGKVAGEGYIAMAPDLFYRQGDRLTCGYTEFDKAMKWIGNLKDDELNVDVGATLDHLKAQPNVRGERFGIVGFCVGGRISYLIAGSSNAIGAAVVYYGGRIMAPFGNPPTPFDRTPNIQAPVLGLFGEEDSNPSPDDVRKIEAELKKHGKTYDFHIYPNAGHGFNCDERASYAPEAARDAWGRTLAWFERYLEG